MNIVYIVAIIILLVVLYVIYQYAKFVLKSWRTANSLKSKVLCMLGMITFACVIICWLILIYWTIDCWYISNYTAGPKPHFLVMYVLGFFVLGICMALSQLFLGINELKKGIKNKPK